MSGTGESLRVVQPEGWRRPRGYSNGLVAPSGARLLSIAGQIGWDANETLVDGGFLGQATQALDNVLAVVEAAGGSAQHVVRVTWYVVDKHEYLAATRDLGTAFRARFGDHYPVSTLVQVADLLEEGARVEVEATAALPPENA